MKFQGVRFLAALLLVAFLSVNLAGCGSSGSAGSDDDGGGTTPQPQTGNLSGTVFNALGQPVSGATVSVFSDQYTGTTDTNGQFLFNVSQAPHTLMISRDGSVDTFRFIDLTGGVTSDNSMVLRDSLVSSPARLATAPHVINSNTVGGFNATLVIPPQASGAYTVGGATGLASSRISLEYLNINDPLPFPLPCPSSRSSQLNAVLGIDKQTPSVLVWIKPSLLSLETAGTLTLPNPHNLPASTRILRLDPASHCWLDTGNTIGNIPFPIAIGGVYGIFGETESNVCDVLGTGYTPGCLVMVGDQVFTVGADGAARLFDVHAPMGGGSLNVTILDPATGAVYQSTVTPVSGGLVNIQQPTQGDLARITLSVGSTTLIANGLAWTTVTALLEDTAGNPVPDGTLVDFTASAGAPASASATTVNGKASFNLTSPVRVGTATLRASSGGFTSDPVTIQFVSGSASVMTLTATPGNLAADGTSTSQITASVLDAQGNAVDGEVINFAVTSGSGILSSPTATTAGGVASVTYTASRTAGIETISATTAGNVSQTVNINLMGGTIGSIEVTSGSEAIAADGVSQTLITAQVRDTNGNSVADNTAVTFTATAGTLSAAIAQTINGAASVTLTSANRLGSCTITATTGGVSGTASISFTAGAVQTVTLSSTPSSLTANGTATSEIRATVVDAGGNPVAEETITFQCGAGVLSAATAVTDESGIATVTYTAPLTAPAGGIANVIATSTNGKTASVFVTLTSAWPPIYNQVWSVSLRAGASSIVANGVSSVRIEATVSDAIGNPAVDGTAVAFTTTAGTLSSATSTTLGGVASSTLVSSTEVGTATVRGESQGSNATVTVQFIAGPAASIALSAMPANLTADGAGTSQIRAIVLDASGNPVADGETLTFSASDGILSNLTATTSDGMATVTYTAPNAVPASGNATITARTANMVTGTALITLIGPQIAGISLSVNPASLPADGTSQATISAALTLVGGGNAPDGTTANFSITQGGGAITPTATTAGGVATATLTAGNTAETVIVRAEAGGRIAEIQIEYKPGSVTLTIVPNSLLGTGLQTAMVKATLKTANGLAAPAGENVTFTLDDMSLGTVNPQTAVTVAQGVAQTSFTAAAKGGTVTVTATWNTGGVDVTGQGTISIQPPPAFIGIAVGSPDPATVNIKGTGGESTSQIIFDVKDAQGNLVANGYRIDFAILSGPNGGEEISPPFATTVNGQVSTILRSGFKSGPVSIKATYYHNTNVSTATSQITIMAGQPVGEELGIFAQYLNISGLWLANLENQISASANDIYGNAIPDNTAISFKTYETGGDIYPEPDIDPPSNLTRNGLATSILASNAPEPLQGFVSVTAEAVQGGRTTHVTSIAVTPAPAQHVLYAGTDGGGVYKSTNSGDTWENISRSSANPGQNWIDPYINDIAVDPDRPNWVYAATGYLGEGHIYRSTDGGINWNSDNIEEWNGLATASSAVLKVLCDDNGSDYVWIGTDGIGAYRSLDGESFEPGGIVTPLVPNVWDVPELLNTGTGTLSEPILSYNVQTERWDLLYQQTGAEVSTPRLDTSASGSEANGTMSEESGSATANTETWTVTYQGGVTVPPAADPGNTGNGILQVVSMTPYTRTETWTVRCITAAANGGTFRVIGSQSGIAGDYDITSPENFVAQAGGNELLVLYIDNGTIDFAVGDRFSFSTAGDLWSVAGNVSGAQLPARTNVPYTSDNSEVSFTINAGQTFYDAGDFWTFKTVVTGSWQVTGSTTGTQATRAQNNIPYTSNNGEITFLITGGAIPFEDGDTFQFHVTASGLGYGKRVRDIVKVPGLAFTDDNAILYAAAATGVFKSIDGGQTWVDTTTFTGDNITTLAIHPDSNGLAGDIIYAGTVDAGVWVSLDSGASWNSANWTDTAGIGKGLSASNPAASLTNTGNGVMSAVIVSDSTQSENWTLECTAAAPNGGTFKVTGTVSGLQTNLVTVGALYISDGGEVSFTIEDGSVDFVVGDRFTFTTTRDPGRNIEDLLVDHGNNKLYAITYFWGPLEPHAVGNVYVAGLNPDGSINGNWQEATGNLPQYDPPDDTTLFAQHVLAGDIPNNPTALYIGGEGINFYKADSAGLAAGASTWQQSKSGLSNLIFARMPILFSGVCTMYIARTITGDVVTYTIYIQDVNGNPPIAGSAFEVILKQPGSPDVILLSVEYPDTQRFQGTWPDPLDPRTNNPFKIETVVLPGDKIEFTFTPTCEEEAPGCSGSVQAETHSY